MRNYIPNKKAGMSECLTTSKMSCWGITFLIKKSGSCIESFFRLTNINSIEVWHIEGKNNIGDPKLQINFGVIKMLISILLYYYIKIVISYIFLITVTTTLFLLHFYFFTCLLSKVILYFSKHRYHYTFFASFLFLYMFAL